MTFFLKLSIKNKLMVIILSVALPVVFIGFTINGFRVFTSFRSQMKNEAMMSAKLVSEYCITPLDFGYNDEAEDILSKLEARPEIFNGYLFDEDGSLFASYNKIEAVTPPSIPINDNYSKFEENWLHVFRTIKFNNKKKGTIYLRVSTAKLAKDLRHNLIELMFFGTGLIIIAYFLALRLQRVISRPILTLADTTEQISKEADYSIRVRKVGDDEIGTLYNSFNNMLEQIHIREIERDKAEEEKARLNEIIENTSDLVSLALPDTSLLYMNYAGREMLGWNEIDDIGDKSIAKVHTAWAFELVENEGIPAAIKNGVWHGETAIIASDGKEIPVLQVIMSHKLPTGELMYLSTIMRDITERKQAESEIRMLNADLEKRVKVRTEELEFANNELRQFAYAVSHDLKAPLRAVNQLATWISEDYYDSIDEDGQEQLKLLCSRVARMDHLIEGILQYSRLGRTQENEELLNLNELVEDVIESLAPPEHVTVNILSDLPTIKKDRARFGQVFQNLISNAIDCIEKPTGVIEIKCVESGAEWTFSVADNGPGIEEKHFERIFKIFQTLRPRDEKESTGIGLTLVKRIVELYSGKIWLDSEVGKGSTFFFTIPRNDKQAQ